MSRPNGELSTGELLAQLTNQVTRLVRDEVSLAQYEVRTKLQKSGPGVRLLGVGLALALLGAAAIVACLVLVLAMLGVAAWLSALIVGAVVLIIG